MSGILPLYHPSPPTHSKTRRDLLCRSAYIAVVSLATAGCIMALAFAAFCLLGGYQFGYAAPATIIVQRSVPASPHGYNEGLGPTDVHGIGYPGEYSHEFDNGDSDVAKFNAAVYPQNTPASKGFPGVQFTQPMQIPQHISQHNPAAGREFADEDLAFMDGLPLFAPTGVDPEVSPLNKAVAAEQPPTPQQQAAKKPFDPDNVSGGTEIPASEIAAEFPEYEEPKTFSTERVDYSLRTTGGAKREGEEEGPAGEDNSNVAVYSDDKSFHWSNGQGDPLPKNDPQFKEAMTWISSKFKGEKKDSDGGKRAGGKPVQKGRRKQSVFDVLSEF